MPIGSSRVCQFTSAALEGRYAKVNSKGKITSVSGWFKARRVELSSRTVGRNDRRAFLEALCNEYKGDLDYLRSSRTAKMRLSSRPLNERFVIDTLWEAETGQKPDEEQKRQFRLLLDADPNQWRMAIATIQTRERNGLASNDPELGETYKRYCSYQEANKGRYPDVDAAVAMAEARLAGGEVVCLKAASRAGGWPPETLVGVVALKAALGGAFEGLVAALAARPAPAMQSYLDIRAAYCLDASSLVRAVRLELEPMDLEAICNMELTRGAYKRFEPREYLSEMVDCALEARESRPAGAFYEKMLALPSDELRNILDAKKTYGFSLNDIRNVSTESWKDPKFKSDLKQTYGALKAMGGGSRLALDVVASGRDVGAFLTRLDRWNNACRADDMYGFDFFRDNVMRLPYSELSAFISLAERHNWNLRDLNPYVAVGQTAERCKIETMLGGNASTRNLEVQISDRLLRRPARDVEDILKTGNRAFIASAALNDWDMTAVRKAIDLLAICKDDPNASKMVLDLSMEEFSDLIEYQKIAGLRDDALLDIIQSGDTLETIVDAFLADKFKAAKLDGETERLAALEAIHWSRKAAVYEASLLFRDSGVSPAIQIRAADLGLTQDQVRDLQDICNRKKISDSVLLSFLATFESLGLDFGDLRSGLLTGTRNPTAFETLHRARALRREGATTREIALLKEVPTELVVGLFRDYRAKGLPLTEATRIGALHDKNKVEASILDAGGFNTVYKTTFEIQDAASETLVLKPINDVGQEIASGAGVTLGLNAKNLKVAQRNFGFQGIAKKLGWSDVVASGRMAYATMPGQKKPGLNFAMEYARGVSPLQLPDKNVLLRPALREDLLKISLLDKICGNPDRHGGNIIISGHGAPETAKGRAIDNDTSFAKGAQTPDHLSDLEKPNVTGLYGTPLPAVVTRSVFEDIMKLSMDDVIEVMADAGLDVVEIEAALARLVAIKTHLQGLESKGMVAENLEDFDRLAMLHMTSDKAVADISAREIFYPPIVYRPIVA